MANFTLVTGTVLDPNGVPYADGSITAQLVTAGTSPTLNGGSFAMTGSARLSKTGTFTMQLADNNSISPTGLKWLFTVSSFRGTVEPAGGTGPQSFTASITITGATQDISSQLQAAAPALTVTVASSSLGPTVIVPAAGTTLQPASGTLVTLAVPFGDELALQDGGAAGHANQDQITLGPASTGGATGGITLTGCLGSNIKIDGGGTGGNGQSIILKTALVNGPSLVMRQTADTASLQSTSDQNDITVGPGAALSIRQPVTNYAQQPLVSNGLVSSVGLIDLVAQTAAKAATTLFNVTNATAGRVRVSAYLKVTTPATTSSVLGPVTVTFTDGTDSVAQSVVLQGQSKAGASEISDAGNSTTTVFSGELIIWAKFNVVIQVAIGYTSVGGTPMAYEAHITAEQL